MIKPPTQGEALSVLLASLGFEAMASGALTEQDPERLRRYARVIIKQSPTQELKDRAVSLFREMRLGW